jgi:hypothetical protein
LNLFDPSEKLMALSEELGVPITFFTDVLCAIRFRKWEPVEFFEPYCRQIHRMLKTGHDPQLHIHPHWMTSEYRAGKYKPSSDYTLSDFHDKPEPNDIRGIIRQGVEFLNELCRSEKSNYQCVAYRAGGYNLAPQTQTILRSLWDAGIRMDSSLAKGFFRDAAYSRIDFRRLPDAANWRIPMTGELQTEAAQGLYEVPIATKPRTPLNNVPFLVKRVLCRSRRPASHGRGFEQSRAGEVAILQKLRRMIPHSAYMLSSDSYEHSARDLMSILNHHVQSHSNVSEVDCALICHPKSTGWYNLFLMREFVQRARRKYGRDIEFCTMSHLHDLRKLSEPSGGSEEIQTERHSG